MPRLRESEDQKRDKAFRALVAKNRELCNVKSDDELAVITGVSKKTLQRKIKEPDKFTRRELCRIFSSLKFSEEEKAQVM